jgi:cyclopropane-fatty-acyl-phospholipid synthase
MSNNPFDYYSPGIVDGMSIIDLGCGWGSVSIYLASKFPNCKITSVSNSHSQKVFILGRAAERGYKNINVYTGEWRYNCHA